MRFLDTYRQRSKWESGEEDRQLRLQQEQRQQSEIEAEITSAILDVQASGLEATCQREDAVGAGAATAMYDVGQQASDEAERRERLQRMQNDFLDPKYFELPGF